MALRLIVSLVAGGLFGAGLIVSGMVNPARVLGFLDFAGTWDPTLAFVMAGALAVTVPAYWLARRQAKPLYEQKTHVPQPTPVDRRLVTGAVVFGLGWGLAGLCPGPALAALGAGRAEVLAFAAAMAAGMWGYGRFLRR